MAIVYLYMDDFTSYGSISDDPADQFARLTEPGAYTPDSNLEGSYLAAMSSAGSGKALRTVFSDAYCQRAFTLSGAALISHIAGRFRWPDYPGTGKSGIGPGTTIDEFNAFGLQVEDGGYLAVFNWSSDADIVRSLVPVVHATSETHIEVIFTFVDAEGDAPDIIWNYTVQVFVEGEEVELTANDFTLTGQSTNNGQFNYQGIVSCGGSAALLSGDLILATEDETGGDNKVGQLFVGSQLAASDVSNTGPWVPSAGASIYPIFATQPAGDEYASASAAAVPATVENTLTPVNLKAIAIGGVMTIIRGQKVDGGDAAVAVSVISPTGSESGETLSFTGTMTNYQDIRMVDPGTDAAWTPAAVSALNLQTERSE